MNTSSRQSVPESVLNTTAAAVFEQEIARRMADSDDPFSLLIVDMGDISKIFTRSGPTAITKFLQGAAILLNNVRRENDRVYRIGDTTFALLLTGVTSAIHQQLAAEKIIRLHGEAIREMDSPFQAALRIGIAGYPEHADDAGDLIQYARLALEAVHVDEAPYFIYSPETVATMSMRWNLQEDLGTAIENGELEVYYQPKIATRSDAVVGAEALLRWNSEEHGIVAPDVFVPVAREIGLMHELTRFVLTTSLRQAAEWPGDTGNYGISVNLDATTLTDELMGDAISSSLSIWASETCTLTLEITESALVHDSQSNFQFLNKLRELGVGISIDDFGTGYSSLSYFKTIPATELKIDKSFVASMFDSERDRSLVEAIIWLAHRFDMSVVAEGVERQKEFDSLREMKCDVIQGYFVSAPMPHAEFCLWLAAQLEREAKGSVTA